jgi:hypothetical protein
MKFLALISDDPLIEIKLPIVELLVVLASLEHADLRTPHNPVHL